jgi:hypothetical protein
MLLLLTSWAAHRARRCRLRAPGGRLRPERPRAALGDCGPTVSLHRATCGHAGHPVHGPGGRSVRRCARKLSRRTCPATAPTWSGLAPAEPRRVSRGAAKERRSTATRSASGRSTRRTHHLVPIRSWVSATTARRSPVGRAQRAGSRRRDARAVGRRPLRVVMAVIHCPGGRGPRGPARDALSALR